MVEANELLDIQGNNSVTIDYKLAKVVELFPSGTAQIQFYGEELPSEKEYSYLESYKNPTIDDIVLVVYFNDTYIILGSIIYGIVIQENLVSLDTLNAILLDYAKTADLTDFVTSESLTTTLNGYVKTTQLSNYVTTSSLSSTLNGYSPTSHRHDRIINNSYTSYYAHVATVFNGTPCLSPSSTVMCLGASGSSRWDTVYASTGTINTSDLRMKNSIEAIPEKYKELLGKLKPIIYKLNDGRSDRFHVGFGAQDVEKAMEELEIDSVDFAGLIKAPLVDDEGNETGEFEYGLRYSEFIALNIAVTQDNQAEIKELRNQIEVLTDRLEAMERMVLNV